MGHSQSVGQSNSRRNPARRRSEGANEASPARSLLSELTFFDHLGLPAARAEPIRRGQQLFSRGVDSAPMATAWPAA